MSNDQGGDGPDEHSGWAPVEPGAAPTSPPAWPAQPAAQPPPPSPSPPPAWGQPPPPPPPPGWGQPPAAGGWGWPAQPALPKAGSDRTGPLPLHPMTVSDILDGAFKLIKANARTVFGIAAVISLPLQLISSYFLKNSLVGLSDLRALSDPSVAQASVDSQRNNGGQFAAAGIAILLALIVTPFIAGAISRVVAASYLGDELQAGPALRTTLRRAIPLLVAFVLVHLLEFPAFMACVLPGLCIMALYQAVAPAIMVEEIGPIAGMRRSWRLMRGRLWNYMLIALLAGFISSILRNLLGLVPTVIGFLLPHSVRWVVVGLGSGLATVLTVPIVAVVATLVYFDARIRTEGFDLQMIAADLNRGSA